ncbi:MAG: hypothetical protein AB8B55_01035 [Mariniblastus sp.]
MPKRPQISVILLHNREVVRADFGPNVDQPVFRIQEKIDVESTFKDVIEQVVSGQPLLATRTIVASTDVWSQIVSLPKLSVTGIAAEELEEALKFEAETLSGIDIDEISLASTVLGRKDDYQQYWVSAIRQSDLDEVNAVLESAGCREITISHPAGLGGNGQPIEPNKRRKTDGAIDQVEIWDELAYLLSNNGHRLVKIKQATTEQFKVDQIQAKTPVLLGSSTQFDFGESIETDNLATPEIFNQWAGQVAANYLNRLDDLTAPLIRVSKGIRGTPTRHLISALICLGVIGFCFWHWNYQQLYNRTVVEKTLEIKQPAEDKKKFDTQLIAIVEKRAEVELEDTALGDDLKRIRFFLENQSNRIEKLLNLLVELQTPELVIEEIGGTEEGLVISGLSLNGTSAQELAKRLREKAVPLGWVVNPARQEGQQKLTTGGPWNYEILLTDSGPFETAVQPRKKSTVSVKNASQKRQ